jgi:hypothetical protein
VPAPRRTLNTEGQHQYEHLAAREGRSGSSDWLRSLYEIEAKGAIIKRSSRGATART